METRYSAAVDAYEGVIESLRSAAQAIVEAEGSRGFGQARLNGPSSLAIEYVQGRLQARRLHYDGRWYDLRTPADDLDTRAPAEQVEGLLESSEDITSWLQNATGKTPRTDLRSSLFHALDATECHGTTPDIDDLLDDLTTNSSASVIRAYIQGDVTEYPPSLTRIYQNGVGTVIGTAGPYAVLNQGDDILILSTESARQSFIVYDPDANEPESFEIDDVRIALGFDVDAADGTVTASEAGIGTRYGYEDAAVRLLGKLRVRRVRAIESYIKHNMTDEEQRAAIQHEHTQNAEALVDDLGIGRVTTVNSDAVNGASFEIASDDPEAVFEAAANALNIRTPHAIRQNNEVDLDERAEALATLIKDWVRSEYDAIREEHQLTTPAEFDEREVQVARSDKATEASVNYGEYALTIPETSPAIRDTDTVEGRIPILNECAVRVIHPHYGSRTATLPAGVYEIEDLPRELVGYKAGTWDVSRSYRRGNGLV